MINDEAQNIRISMINGVYGTDDPQSLLDMLMSTGTIPLRARIIAIDYQFYKESELVIVMLMIVTWSVSFLNSPLLIRKEK